MYRQNGQNRLVYAGIKRPWGNWQKSKTQTRKASEKIAESHGSGFSITESVVFRFLHIHGNIVEGMMSLTFHSLNFGR